MKTINIILIIVVFFTIQLKAQDPAFSQFQTTEYIENPAFAGFNSDFRVALNYRILYPNIPAEFTNYAFSIDGNIPNLGIGIGVNVLRFTEGNGTLNTTLAGLSFSKIIKLKRGMYMSLGLNGGIINRSSNVDNFVFSDQLDPVLGNIHPSSAPISNLNILQPNFSAGIAFIYKLKKTTHLIGVSADHLNTPKTSLIEGLDNRYPMSFRIRYLAKIKTKNNILRFKTYLHPSFKFITQRISHEYVVGSALSLDFLHLGLYFRSKNIPDVKNQSFLIFSTGFVLKENFSKFIYTYEFVLNSFYSSGGIHEIGMVFNINNLKSKSPCSSY